MQSAAHAQARAPPLQCIAPLSGDDGNVRGDSVGDRQSGIRFLLDGVRANETLGDLTFSDCHFFRRLKASGANSTIVHEALFMHN